MGMCNDFLNEEGMLQQIANNLGVPILLTPKCHAGLAGEGVEYVWACAKDAAETWPSNKRKAKTTSRAALAIAIRWGDQKGKNKQICEASMTILDGISCNQYTSSGQTNTIWLYCTWPSCSHSQRWSVSSRLIVVHLTLITSSSWTIQHFDDLDSWFVHLVIYIWSLNPRRRL